MSSANEHRVVDDKLTVKDWARQVALVLGAYSLVSIACAAEPETVSGEGRATNLQGPLVGGKDPGASTSRAGPPSP
jgi:hypothetical protein